MSEKRDPIVGGIVYSPDFKAEPETCVTCSGTGKVPFEDAFEDAMIESSRKKAGAMLVAENTALRERLSKLERFRTNAVKALELCRVAGIEAANIDIALRLDPGAPEKP